MPEQTPAPQLPQLTMEQFTTLMQNTIGSIVKELGLDKVDRKHGIFPATSEEEIKGWTKEKRINKFLRTVLSKNPNQNALSELGVAYREIGDLAVGKIMSEGTDSAGGYLVPEEFRTDVIREAEMFGWVRKNAFVFPTDSDVINLTDETSAVTVTYENENATIDHSQPVLARPTITVKKLAGITSLSNELFADAKFPLVQYLVTTFAEAIAGAEDTQGLAGTGSPFTGLLNAASATITTTAETTFDSAVTPDNLLTLIFSIADKHKVGARFVMHPTVFGNLLNKKAAGGGTYHMIQPGVAGTPATIWSYPVDTSEKMPSTTGASTKFVVFANPKKLWVADRQQMTVAVATEGTVNSVNLFETDAQAIRVTNRHGMVAVRQAGIGVLKTGS